MKTDQFDKQILRHLPQSNRITADELAVQVRLSASAVQRRLKRLRDEKILEADVSIIAASAAGLEIACVINVALERDTSQALDKFKTAMLKSPEVVQCYYVTGSYDFKGGIWYRNLMAFTCTS